MFSGLKINSTEVSRSPPEASSFPLRMRPLSASPPVLTLTLKQCFCLLEVLKALPWGGGVCRGLGRGFSETGSLDLASELAHFLVSREGHPT